MKINKFGIVIGIVILSLFNINISAFAEGKEKITLLSPIDEQWIGSESTFKWEGMDGDQIYTIYISEDKESLENKEFLKKGVHSSKIKVKKETNETSWKSYNLKHLGSLQEGEDYFWMISSNNGHYSKINKIFFGFPVHIIVQDTNDSPIDYAWVDIKTGGTTTEQKEGNTDKDGKITLYYFGEGKITIAKNDYVVISEEWSQLNINITEEQEYTFTITNKGDVEIKVRDEIGNPVSLIPENIVIFKETDKWINLINDSENPLNITDASNLEEGLIKFTYFKDDYIIQINKSGFEANENYGIKFKINSDETTSFTYILINIRSQYSLTVKSDGIEVQDAEVFIDGNLLGYTNKEGKIDFISSIGNHNVIIKKGGYELYQDPVSVQEDQKNYDITLTSIEIPDPNRVVFLLIRLMIIIFSVLFLILLILIITQRKKNNRLQIETEKQKTEIKDNIKEIKTLRDYIAEILRRT